MNKLAAILMLFGALILGWAPAVTQARAMSVNLSQHHTTADRSHGGSHTAQADSHHDCVPAKAACEHPKSMVHPTLCSACFAITPDTISPPDVTLPAGRPHAQVQAPLHPTTRAPASPPPKA